jgi:hypothetical protein
MFIEHSQPPEPTELPDWPAPDAPDGECTIDCSEPSELPADLRAGPKNEPAHSSADRGRPSKRGRRRIGE